MASEQTQENSARALTGRLAEYDELLELLSQRPGLLVVSSDPWSGTSVLLDAAVEQLGDSVVRVDARSSGDVTDLAMAIADAAVSALASSSAAWWSGAGPASGRGGLRLLRTLSAHGIDPDLLRGGDGADDERLHGALELALALGDGQAALIIDHLGLLLAALPAREAREVLGVLRAVRQRHPALDLVLVEHRGGGMGTALADERHPLYRAGQRMEVRRPGAMRFHQDLAITRGWTRVSDRLLVAAAELAEGVPALTWQIVDRAPRRGLNFTLQAAAGWEHVRCATEASTARQWDVLRRVHPLAQAVTAALASNLGPHVVDANSKSVNDVLRRLRDLGMAWQPGSRMWVLADPLLTAWVRDHPPAWVRRRCAAIR